MGVDSKNSNPKFTGEGHIFHYTFLFDAYVPSICFSSVQIFAGNLNGAGNGTGDNIEKRPDSRKLFERKKYGIQLHCDNFRTGCQSGPVRRLGFF